MDSFLWTLLTGTLVIGGAVLIWVIRPDVKSRGWGHLIAVLGALALAGGVSLLVYRWFERAWPLAPIGSAPGAAGVQVSAAGGLELLALVLTLLTGIAVQYITSALATIKQQRDEVDKEVELYKNYKALRAELAAEVDSWHRLRHYLFFSEAYIEKLIQGVAPSAQAGELARIAFIRRLFQPYELPLDQNSPLPDSLRDVGQVLKVLAQRESHLYRRHLGRTHLDYVDAFARRIRDCASLTSADRQEMLDAVRRLHQMVDADRRRKSASSS